MARHLEDNFSSSNDTNQENWVEIDATGQNHIQISEAKFIADSDISRHHQDLRLEASDGDVLIIQNYFSLDEPPLIESQDGSILTSSLINSFLNTSPEYAQYASLNDASPVGAVEEITGDATVTRTDGTSEKLSLGSPIYNGDTITTSGDGAVNISFIDDTSMAVSENARLSIDEYQFDPSTESGETNLSVLRGVFVFTSGLIGRDDPDDVKIDTPVGSIGIRGTVIAGHINPGGDSKVTVVEGAIVITNGVSITTLSQQYESIKMGGFNDKIENIGVQDASTIGKTYGSVSDVVPKLFSSINDNIKQENEDQPKTEETIEDVIDTSEEVLNDEKNSTETEAREGNIDTDLINIDLLSTPPQGEKLIDAKGLLKEHRSNDPSSKSIINKLSFEGTQLNLNLFDNIKINTTGFKFFEGMNEGDIVARFFANGNSKNNVTYKFSNGTALSADGNFEIFQTNNGQAQVRLTANGESNFEAFTEGTPLGSAYVIQASNTKGQIRSFSFTPETLDAVINVNKAGGINFKVSEGIAIDSSTIGDFNGDGVNDRININETLNELTIQNGATNTNIGSPLQNFSSVNHSNISSVGDINNDGFTDLVYGRPGTGSGSVSLLSGTDTTPTSSILFNAGSAGDQIGYTVTGIGDFDGNGKLDYAFSAPGKDTAGNNTGTIYFTLNGGTDFNVDGHSSGMELGNSIAGLGDINGDGYSDVIFSATNQVSGNYQAYILHGQTSPSISNASDAETTISTPYEIVGVGSAGDMNGDGYDDTCISLQMGYDINTYVIYGANGLPPLIDMAFLENPDNALKIHHADVATAGEYEVTSVGDQNGDGFDDIQVGIVDHDQYLINGQAADNVVTDESSNDSANPDTGKIAASANNQSLAGDTHFIDNNKTDLSMRGGAGRNDFSITNTEFRNIDGGSGIIDTIRYGENDGTLDFSDVNFEQIEQIERIHFTKDDDTIKLTAENIFNLLKTSDNGSLTIELDQNPTAIASNATLKVDASSPNGDTIQDKIVNALNEKGSGATYAGEVDGNDHYEIGGYNLYIDTDVTTQVI